MTERSRLRAGDVIGLSVLGSRARPLRTFLSGGSIAVGIATMVAVFGISTSSRAQLVAEIDALGTNLLTVTPGQSFSGQAVTLPTTAPAMIRRIGPVLGAAAIGDVTANVYRNPHVSAANTNAITVYATPTNLLQTLQGRLAAGAFVNAATSRLPAVVLGAGAASALGIDRASLGSPVWLGHQSFAVVGILQPLVLAPELDRSALIGYPIAERALRADGAPVEIYVRTDPASVDAVKSVLAATTDPAAPQNVAISNPSDALTARAAAAAAFQGLFLALGAVALLVGGIGIANVMIIAVLERRTEIGVRRALGATRTHITAQFVGESALVALLGGSAGAIIGGFVTAVYAASRDWNATVPMSVLVGAVGIALALGVVAGSYPARKAARLAPTEALRA